MLISVFHGQHGSLLVKKQTDLLWNYLPWPPWKDHPEHPVRQLPCCLLPRKVFAFSSQNDSHTDYDVSPAPSHITFMSVILTASLTEILHAGWSNSSELSRSITAHTRKRLCHRSRNQDLNVRKTVTTGDNNNNLSTEESFPAHATILCKRIWCHPHLRRTVSGRTSLHQKSFCWVLIPHHGSYRHALTERMRIERNNHKWWEDTLYNDSMLRHQKYSSKYFKKIFYCKLQKITWCQYNFFKHVILITLWFSVFLCKSEKRVHERYCIFSDVWIKGDSGEIYWQRRW